MTFLKTFSATGLAGGLLLVLGAPAQAVTCEEFAAMTPDMQRGVLVGIDAGRAEARAMGRSTEMQDAGDAVIVSQDDDMEGGREELREGARGVDDAMFVQVVDDCKNAPDRDVTGVLPPSTMTER